MRLLLQTEAIWELLGESLCAVRAVYRDYRMIIKKKTLDEEYDHTHTHTHTHTQNTHTHTHAVYTTTFI